MEEFTDDNQLEIIVRDSGLEKTKADIILTKFQDYFTLASDWERKAKSIRVTDENQTDDMKIARTGRLLLRERRLEIENTRKQLKEQSLREGKAIDGIANVLKALIIPIEEHLERQEKFVEFKKAAELERIRIEQERIAAENEQKRIAAEAAERERVRAENARLIAEIAKKNAELEKAKEIENKARAEAQARQDEALRIERAKAAEIARIAQEKARVAKEKADRELAEARAEAKRLEEERRSLITCPHCKKQFKMKEESSDW